MKFKGIFCCINILFLIYVVNCIEIKPNKFLNYEQKLIDKLLTNYNNKLMPSGNIEIKIAFNLIQLIQIIERDQIMLINAFVDHKWIDERLKWGLKHYLSVI
jgi:hypothetical protein